MTSNYPNYPNYSSSEPDPVAPARPKPVDTSFLLWITSAAIGVIGFVVGLSAGREATREQLIEDARQRGENLTDSQIDTLVTTGFVVGGLLVAVLLGLYLLFAFKMRAGRNWARITLAVLGGISLVLAIIQLTGGNAVSTLVTLVQIALIGGAIYFMYTKEASGYFDAHKRRP